MANGLEILHVPFPQKYNKKVLFYPAYRLTTYKQLIYTGVVYSINSRGGINLDSTVERNAFVLTDEDLCEMYRDNDADAARTLVLKYMPMIRRQADNFKNGSAEVEDLIQEGLMGFFRAIKTYDISRGASFKTYAYTCSCNRMLSALVAQKPSISGVGAASGGEPSDPQQVLIEREQYALLIDSIEDILSEFEYQTLRLYLNGVSYESIAAVLGVTTKSIDNALQRVRKKLKAVLKRPQHSF